MEVLSRVFIGAKFNRVPVTKSLAELASVANGYELQNAIIEQNDTKLGKLVGWKVGATNAAVMKALGFGPFYGPLFESNFNTTTRTAISDQGTIFRGVEAEIAFDLLDDVPPLQSNEEYEPHEIMSKIKHMYLGIEFAGTRIPIALTPAMVVGDFGLNGSIFIHKEPFQINSTSECMNGLADIKVTMDVNGANEVIALGSNVLDNPINSLTWLANALIKDNKQLYKDQIVMTGAVILMKDVKADDIVNVTCEYNSSKRYLQLEMIA